MAAAGLRRDSPRSSPVHAKSGARTSPRSSSGPRTRSRSTRDPDADASAADARPPPGRARRAHAITQSPQGARQAGTPATCRGCGKPLTDSRRPDCEDCRSKRWIEQASRSRRTTSDVTGDLRDGLAEQLHTAILQSPAGMTRTQIQRLLTRNVPGERIQAALDALQVSGRAQRQRVRTAGRPAERWIATATAL